MSWDGSDDSSIHSGSLPAGTTGLPAGRGGPDRLQLKLESLEESVAALQSGLAAAHQANHDLVSSS